MCSLFGIINYNKSLNKDQINTILKVLASECEVRGTDATGIAYNNYNRLVVYKRPLPSHKMKFNVPHGVNIVMGHTRLTTQGLQKYNYNNHPFLGRCSNTNYALAHNGIIYNDDILKKKHNLKDTNIKTDTYVTVQLLDKYKSLDFKSIAKSVEELEGYFTFTILDNDNNLYIVKGESPLAIYHFKKHGFYIYASTKEILNKSLSRLGINNIKYNEIKLYEGDILKISSSGELSESEYVPNDFNSILNYRYYSYTNDKPQNKSKNLNILNDDYSYYKLIVEYAKRLGFMKQEIDQLINAGFEIDLIEELLNYPEELSMYIDYVTVGGNSYA